MTETPATIPLGNAAKASAPSLATFIGATTEIAHPPAVPEIRLHLAPDLTALWEHIETTYGVGRPTPYWAAAWVGGQALARFLLDRPETVVDKSVFDFGTGGGQCAIAAMLAGAASVVACDSDPMARTAAGINAALNGVSVEIRKGDFLGRDLDEFDVVLAADVWYERQFAERATAWLRRQAGAGATVLVGDMRRAYFPRAGLEPLAEYKIPTSTDTERLDLTPAGVWRVLS